MKRVGVSLSLFLFVAVLVAAMTVPGLSSLLSPPVEAGDPLPEWCEPHWKPVAPAPPGGTVTIPDSWSNAIDQFEVWFTWAGGTVPGTGSVVNVSPPSRSVQLPAGAVAYRLHMTAAKDDPQCHPSTTLPPPTSPPPPTTAPPPPTVPPPTVPPPPSTTLPPPSTTLPPPTVPPAPTTTSPPQPPTPPSSTVPPTPPTPPTTEPNLPPIVVTPDYDIVPPTCTAEGALIVHDGDGYTWGPVTGHPDRTTAVARADADYTFRKGRTVFRVPPVDLSKLTGDPCKPPPPTTAKPPKEPPPKLPPNLPPEPPTPNAPPVAEPPPVFPGELARTGGNDGWGTFARWAAAAIALGAVLLVVRRFGKDPE